MEKLMVSLNIFVLGIISYFGNMFWSSRELFVLGCVCILINIIIELTAKIMRKNLNKFKKIILEYFLHFAILVFLTFIASIFRQTVGEECCKYFIFIVAFYEFFILNSNVYKFFDFNILKYTLSNLLDLKKLKKEGKDADDDIAKG